ncbi:MAG TPA: hypothetical protein DDZ51_16175 [Planctomycetaceae bacterium]|nr:hypothetical protein [Planctomycetaceae bacterium]
MPTIPPAPDLTADQSPSPSAGRVEINRFVDNFWKSDGAPAWLTSLIVHTILLILLMLMTIRPGSKQPLTIVSRTGPPTAIEQPIAIFEMPIEPTQSESESDADSPADSQELSRQMTAMKIDPKPLDFSPPIVDVGTEASESEADKIQQTGLDLAAILSASSSTNAQQMTLRLPSGGMSPRTPKARAELGAMYGATPESEQAVEMALAWLAEHQQRDGSWSFDLTIDPCRGRCSHSRVAGDNATPATAATGLSLLAFLGAGYTHREGKYAEVVRRGVYYLRDAARPSTHGLDLQAGSMYGHGIATLALTEILAIDHYNNQVDADIKELVEGAILFTLVAQHPQGGWRYVPGSPGDMTISGWQILSLVSARYSGIALRTTTLSNAKDFVNSLSQEGSYEFGYVSKRAEPTTTAIGLCLLMYLGESPFPTPFSRALSQMAARGPKKIDVYHDYYATMALHNARHPDWERWHKPLRDHLIRTQATTGHEKGSWHFKDRHGDVGGRLYTTAMAAMILEVYYRHIPLYQHRDAF